MDHYYIGVDNGLTGGLAILSEEEFISSHSFLTYGFQRTEKRKGNRICFEENIVAIKAILSSIKECNGNPCQFNVLIEKPHGARSYLPAVSMLESYIRIEDIFRVLAFDLPVKIRESETQYVWKRYYWSAVEYRKIKEQKEKESKQIALEMFQKTFPELEIPMRKKKIHDGIVDAVLIANYLRATSYF